MFARFKDLFETKQKLVQLSHIRNLVVLGFSDGEASPNAKAFIAGRALRAGLTEVDVARIVSKPASLGFYVPESFDERLAQLCELVGLMVQLGSINGPRISFCEAVAARFGMPDASGMVQALIAVATRKTY
jgi:hypothetical protein